MTAEVAEKKHKGRKALDVDKYKDYSVVQLLTMSEDPARPASERLEMALVARHRLNTDLIDPTKEAAKKEKSELSHAAGSLAAAKEAFRTEVFELFGSELLEKFGKIANKYVEQGHGSILSVEIVGAKDSETGEFGVTFASTISKPRTKKVAQAEAEEPVEQPAQPEGQPA
jgi:hypothetical protein